MDILCRHQCVKIYDNVSHTISTLWLWDMGKMLVLAPTGILAEGSCCVVPLNRLIVVCYPVCVLMEINIGAFGLDVIATTCGPLDEGSDLVQRDADSVGRIVHRSYIALKWGTWEINKYVLFFLALISLVPRWFMWLIYLYFHLPCIYMPPLQKLFIWRS